VYKKSVLILRAFVVARSKWHTESKDGTAPQRTKTPLKAGALLAVASNYSIFNNSQKIPARARTSKNHSLLTIHSLFARPLKPL